MSKFLTMAVIALCLSVVCAAQTVNMGSKRFTESHVLAEIGRALLEQQGIQTGHRERMGATLILWQALLQGEIQAYPDYTGTLAQEILRLPGRPGVEEIRAALNERGLDMTEPLGFNNTYALVMRRDVAEELGISKISDLRNHPNLTAAIGPEFYGRQDGWKPMSQKYGLNIRDVRTVDHRIGYAALERGEAQLKDAYSTDPEIAQKDLLVLEDDLEFFPPYDGVFVFRKDVQPEAVEALRRAEGTLDDANMSKLNAIAEQTSNSGDAVRAYFNEILQEEVATTDRGWAERIWGWTLAHLQLVGISMLFAILIGIPLGIIASRGGALGGAILGFVGMIQTIPSLALLALLVPLMGISPWTAIFALFLYSLLPIVRNTATGLQGIPLQLKQAAKVLGLTRLARMTQIQLPMAAPSILAGIKTSAIINVGTATLAALIGAGGLGEPIIAGLSLNDTQLILAGAIPAAMLALIVQFGFDQADRLLIPRGLRLG
ncbi:MAG: glycine betaine ABC transporter substrate-binding protein [Fimbriimonadaceae bacterium]